MDSARITCPSCGKLEMAGVELYNARLRKQRFELSPVLPTCKSCGAEVIVRHRCLGGRLIVVNGTCGSGKSTVAQVLSSRYGYPVIDGDCAMQSLKHKLGVDKAAFDSQQMLEEIAAQIDLLSIFSDAIVLSHVIMPGDMERYKALFAARSLDCHFFLLKPDYAVAVDRCRTRTCHTSVTPEYWIKHFYDNLVFEQDFITLDNTHMSAEATALRILELSGIPAGVDWRLRGAFS